MNLFLWRHSNRIGYYFLLLITFSLLLISGCSPEHIESKDSIPEVPARSEIVMSSGMKIIATTSVGTITITADKGLKRSYTWEGATRSVIMYPRYERWFGNLGIYYPGPGYHWKEHNGIRRAVVEEGQQHFSTVEEALTWIRSREEGLAYIERKTKKHLVYRMPFVYTDDGLAVGWTKVLPRSQLNVDVWQIYIDGKKPVKLPDSNNDKIVVEYLNQNDS